MKILILALFSLASIFASAQGSINQTDASGNRQGLWKKQYPNGKLIYEGRFADNKPVGNWKRYHDNGKIQAEITYKEKTDSAFTKLFDLSGNQIAEGVFLNQKKTGNWKYFSEGKLVSEESFRDGIKNGTSKKYYQTGELLEDSEWKNGLQDGKYKAFFKNGKPFMECTYLENKREGYCVTYNDSGKMEMEAFYKSDIRHGDWKYYDKKGELNYTLQYNNGELLNPGLLDSIQTVRLNELDQNKGKIPDPEKFLENPEEYIRKQK